MPTSALLLSQGLVRPVRLPPPRSARRVRGWVKTGSSKGRATVVVAAAKGERVAVIGEALWVGKLPRDDSRWCVVGFYMFTNGA